MLKIKTAFHFFEWLIEYIRKHMKIIFPSYPASLSPSLAFLHHCSMNGKKNQSSTVQSHFKQKRRIKEEEEKWEILWLKWSSANSKVFYDPEKARSWERFCHLFLKSQVYFVHSDYQRIFCWLFFLFIFVLFSQVLNCYNVVCKEFFFLAVSKYITI